MSRPLSRSEAQRRVDRSKASERRLAKWLVEHDGPDPTMMPGAGLATKTGRVGHLFQFDVPSLHYDGENKNIRVGSLWKVWKQITDIARSHGKEPMVRIEPTNEDARRYPKLHIITESRHAALLDAERELLALRAKSGILEP